MPARLQIDRARSTARGICSQQIILCAFGWSPQELPLKYQVDVLFMNISVKMA
jgi:hypothetical protein